MAFYGQVYYDYGYYLGHGDLDLYTNTWFWHDLGAASNSFRLTEGLVNHVGTQQLHRELVSFFLHSYTCTVRLKASF